MAAAGPEIDAAGLLNAVNLDPEGDWNPKVMIADAAYYDLLEKIAEQIYATDLPLRVGASMRCDDYGALGLAWKAAPTLLGSFARVERYARLWTSVVEYELRELSQGTALILHRDGERRLGLRLSNEATLASAVSICRQVSTVPFSPLEVHFKHGAPRSIEYHQDYFGCAVLFDSEFDALVVSRDALARPNKLGDQGLTQFLMGHLDDELNKIGQDNSLETQTKEAIARSLSDGLPKMAEIARGLGMSARSFHRRLSEHGLSFHALTDLTRQELAEGLMRDEQYSLAEVAFLTGFSEQSSFTRAFKRWVGDTPASYRKTLLGA